MALPSAFAFSAIAPAMPVIAPAIAPRIVPPRSTMNSPTRMIPWPIARALASAALPAAVARLRMMPTMPLKTRLTIPTRPSNAPLKSPRSSADRILRVSVMRPIVRLTAVEIASSTGMTIALIVGQLARKNDTTDATRLFVASKAS